MAPSSGLWMPIALRMLRHAVKNTASLIEARLAKVSQAGERELQPLFAYNKTQRLPINRIAAIRQSKGRWYSTQSTINGSLRRFMSTAKPRGAKFDRASFPSSATATAVGRLTARAPFASTLRPNLTGGAFPRTSGGYSLGGGGTGAARHFSHTPTAPAQVVNNVSAAVRAFWISGQKAQFDGLNSHGEKKYRSVTVLQDQTNRKWQSLPKSSPGSFIDFQVSPTMTSLSPIGAAFSFGSGIARDHTATLNTEGFLDVLSVDFARALKDLAAIMNDLKRLSALGDLPILLEDKNTLRVRFPGCDSGTVESLCDELGVQRGVVRQDPEFDESVGGRLALLFPFAPTSEHPLSSPGGSLRSESGQPFEPICKEDYECPWENNPWESSPEGYETMDDLGSESGSVYFTNKVDPHATSSYEGLEGIYRFIEQCDNSKRIS